MKLNYQGKQLKLHQRATIYLKLLIKAQERQTNIEKDLSKWRGANYDEPIRLMNRYEDDYLIKIARMNEIQKFILKRYHWLILDLYKITEDFVLPVNILFI